MRSSNCTSATSRWIGILLVSLLATSASAQTRISDVIYMKAGGAAFTLDVAKPATDLANWGKQDYFVTEDAPLAVFIPALGFDPKGSRSDWTALANKLSPIRLVTPTFPPTLIVHGDVDKVVPIQQAQLMDAALTEAGVEHKIEIVSGGGQDDKTFGPGVMKAVQWFKEKLLR